MIVTKTPLRIAFFGGGSDLPEFYNKSPGLVLSTAIDRHIQIAVNKCEPKHTRVVYSDRKSTRLNSSHSQQSRMPSSA